MSGLLPSRPDLATRDEPEPRLVGIDDEAADEVFEALAPETARTMFATLHDEPASASALAKAADTSVQNARYHLEKLVAADLVEVAGTQYSSKGREMDLYAPADEPLVMLAGSEESAAGLRALLGELLGGVGVLAVLSLLVHAVVEGDLPFLEFTGAAGGSGAGQPGVPLATAVFIGGLVVLALAAAWWHWSGARATVLHWIWRYPVLSGIDLARSRQAVVAATVGAAGLAAVWLGLAATDVIVRAVGPFGPAQWLLGGLVAGAALQAYANDGLLVSWAVVFLPLFGLAVASLGLGLAAEGLASVAGVIGYPVLIATIGAVTIGTAGFVVGVGLRVLVGGLAAVTATAERE